MSTNEQRQSLREMPVFIVLGRPPLVNGYRGLVEHSFCMDWHEERVNMFWSGEAYSILGKHDLDGKSDAQYNADAYIKRLPDWTIEVFDAKSEACPVEIDFESWISCLSNSNGLKFYKRNAKFVMKDIV